MMIFRSSECSDLLLLQEWNEKMALLAEQKASSCRPDFPSSNSTSLTLVGWNTNISAFGVASFSDVIDGWFAEGRDFDYLSGKCRESATCQHYTQVYTSRCIKQMEPGCVWVAVCCRAAGVGHITPRGLCQAAVSESRGPLGGVRLRLLPRVTATHVFPLQSSTFTQQEITGLTKQHHW